MIVRLHAGEDGQSLGFPITYNTAGATDSEYIGIHVDGVGVDAAGIEPPAFTRHLF